MIMSEPETEQKEHIIPKNEKEQDASVPLTLASNPISEENLTSLAKYKKPSFSMGVISRTEIRNPASLTEKSSSRTENNIPSIFKPSKSSTKSGDKKSFSFKPLHVMSRTEKFNPSVRKDKLTSKYETLASNKSENENIELRSFISKKFTPKHEFNTASSITPQSIARKKKDRTGEKNRKKKKSLTKESVTKEATHEESRDEMLARLNGMYQNVKPSTSLIEKNATTTGESLPALTQGQNEKIDGTEEDKKPSPLKEKFAFMAKEKEELSLEHKSAIKHILYLLETEPKVINSLIKSWINSDG